MEETMQKYLPDGRHKNDGLLKHTMAENFFPFCSKRDVYLHGTNESFFWNRKNLMLCNCTSCGIVLLTNVW